MASGKGVTNRQLLFPPHPPRYHYIDLAVDVESIAANVAIKKLGRIVGSNWNAPVFSHGVVAILSK